MPREVSKRSAPAARTAWLGLAVVGLAVYVWFAVQLHLSADVSRSDPSGDRRMSWLAGPSADRLNEEASAHIDRSLAFLEDRSLPTRERIRSYRGELTVARELLIRSLRSQPAQARTLARLAAVRWELDPPLTEADTMQTLQTISLASEMAPTAPQVQRDLGALLLRMGRRREAADYLHRATRLDPALSDEVILAMREHLLDATEILEALPDRPEVLAGLQPAFVEDGRERAYLDAVEAGLAPGVDVPWRLLAAYGNVCLRLDEAERLRRQMDALGPLNDADSDAERLRQRSRAHLARNDPPRALADAREARDLRPSPVYSEHLGDVLLAIESASEAIGAFREALGIVAGGSGNATTRARLYRKIGQAEEQRGRVEKAYDAYELALRLDPEEPHSKRRIREMREAAGILRPSG